MFGLLYPQSHTPKESVFFFNFDFTRFSMDGYIFGIPQVRYIVWICTKSAEICMSKHDKPLFFFPFLLLISFPLSILCFIYLRKSTIPWFILQNSSFFFDTKGGSNALAWGEWSDWSSCRPRTTSTSSCDGFRSATRDCIIGSRDVNPARCIAALGGDFYRESRCVPRGC